MALWGTDETQDESKPTWQRDKDSDGSKGRPAINEERNTFATTADRSADPKRKHSGWVRKVTKTLPDGTVRVIEELLVATSKSVNDLPTRLGAANVTSATFRTSGTIAANSVGTIDTSANLIVDVSFNEAVDVNGGTAVIQVSNGTVDFNLTAYPDKWDGVSSTWGLGSQNNTNMISFVTPIGPQTTGNGAIKITAAEVVAAGSITDNVSGTTSILTLGGTRKDSTPGGLGTIAVLSTANAVLSGNVFERSS